jgi:hypothetical protein
VVSLVFQEGVADVFGMPLDGAKKLVGLFDLGFGSNDGLGAVPQWKVQSAIEYIGEVPFCGDDCPSGVGKEGGPCVSSGFLAICFGAEQDAGDSSVDLVEDAFISGGAAASAVTSVEKDADAFGDVFSRKAMVD